MRPETVHRRIDDDASHQLVAGKEIGAHRWYRQGSTARILDDAIQCQDAHAVLVARRQRHMRELQRFARRLVRCAGQSGKSAGKSEDEHGKGDDERHEAAPRCLLQNAFGKTQSG